MHSTTEPHRWLEERQLLVDCCCCGIKQPWFSNGQSSPCPEQAAQYVWLELQVHDIVSVCKILLSTRLCT